MTNSNDGRPCRVAVIGVGSIGERHVRCFLATGRAVVSCVEPVAALRDAVCQRYGITGYAELAPALAAGIDAAVVATPAPHHVPVASVLAEAGVHLLIEKPLAVNSDGVDRLIELIDQKRIKAGVAYVNRARPVLADLKAALDDNRFGRPLQLTAICGQHFPTYRPAYRQTYFARHADGGGAVQDALTHILNVGEWLLGPITRVCADADHLALDGVTVEDTVHVLSRHSNVMASYSLNQHQAPNEITLTIVCERGTVRWEAHHDRWQWTTEPGNAWHTGGEFVMQRDDLFTRQANAFLDCVEDKAAPLCTVDEGLQTFRVNQAVLDSARDRAWKQIATSRQPVST